jgi:coatomer subunit beta
MASLETIIFIREVVEIYPQHRQQIVKKLNNILDEIQNHLVLRVAVWIIGEYAISQEEVDAAFQALKTNIGSLPIFTVATEDEESKKNDDENQGPRIITKTIILPDGSYGTETINLDEQKDQDTGEDGIPLRKAIKSSEDDFLASCISISLTKLAIKSKKNLAIKKFNKMSIESSLIICALLRGQKKTADLNNIQRMQVCLKILTTPKLLASLSGVQKILSEQGKRIFQKFLESNSRLLKDKQDKTEDQIVITQPDETIQFR